MLKKLSVIWLLALLTGCDLLGQPTDTKVAESQVSELQLKWATIDRHKLTSALSETLKTNNPELDADKKRYAESLSERNLAQGQVSDLEWAAKQNCVVESSKNDRNSNPKIPPRPASQKRYEDISNQVFSSSDGSFEVVSDYRLRENPEYMACINKIAEDPLINDLKKKLKSFHDLDILQRGHETKLRKQADNALVFALESYSKQHGYQLIISDSSQNIMYNQGKVVLNVTDDVLDYISKNPTTVAEEPVQEAK